MKTKLMMAALLIGGVATANGHVIGTITDGTERITLTDVHSCDKCEFDASTTASGMSVTWNYTDIDGILEIDESDGVRPADARKYTVGQDVHLTAFGTRFMGPAND